MSYGNKPMSEALKEFKTNEKKLNEGDSAEVKKIKEIGKKAKMLSKSAFDNSNVDLDSLEKQTKKMAKDALKLNTNYFTPDEQKEMESIADGKFKGSGFGPVAMDMVSKVSSLIGESKNPLTNPNRKDKKVEEAKSEDETMKPYIDKASKELKNVFDQGKAGYGEGNAIGHVISAIKDAIPSNQIKWIKNRINEKVNEAKSAEASMFLKLMDSEHEELGYKTLLSIVTTANGMMGADVKKLEKELDQYV